MTYYYEHVFEQELESQIVCDGCGSTNIFGNTILLVFALFKDDLL